MAGEWVNGFGVPLHNLHSSQLRLPPVNCRNQIPEPPTPKLPQRRNAAAYCLEQVCTVYRSIQYIYTVRWGWGATLSE